jgi:copper homeostasis protein
MSKHITVEVCAFSYEWCVAAKAAGASRVELCAGIYEGGTTPSAGLVQQVAAITGLELAVMVRPRGGDFHYSAAELQTIEHDILFAKNTGANQVVLGVLNPNGTVNEPVIKHLVQLAMPMGLVFHRAIDLCPNQAEAVNILAEAGCKRILTSGGQPTAIRGVDTLKAMVAAAAGRIEIMAGSGVNPQNASQLLATGVDALHLSGRQQTHSNMIHRPSHITMSDSPSINDYLNYTANQQLIAEVVQIAQS